MNIHNTKKTDGAKKITKLKNTTSDAKSSCRIHTKFILEFSFARLMRKVFPNTAYCNFRLLTPIAYTILFWLVRQDNTNCRATTEHVKQFVKVG